MQKNFLKNIREKSEVLGKLWLEEGFQSVFGGFAENINVSGGFKDTVFRAMVQARQIYSVSVFQDLGIATEVMRTNALKAANLLISKYQTPSGAVWNSINEKHEVVDATHGFYAQAFALFGWAYAYRLSADPRYEIAAAKLLQYLQDERGVSTGGFYELGREERLFLANPHMHLFEAALAWIEVSQENHWKSLAKSLLRLCDEKFIPNKDGMLAEYYTESWTPILDTQSRFVVEPGHQCEWAWLIGRYDRLVGQGSSTLKVELFEKAEVYGLNQEGFIVDEVWSDGEVKSHRSRLWPQCERVKAAAMLAEDCSADKYSKLAGAGVERVLSYISDGGGLPLWREYYHGEGRYQYFEDQWVKASSLYHVMGALSEYDRVFGRKENE